MRIAVIVSTYPPYRGGMGNVAADHVAALEAAGHQVDVLSPGRSLRPVFRYGNAAWLPQLLWKLGKYDAVELHYPFFGGAEFVWIWKRLFGRKKHLVVLYHMDTVGEGFVGTVFGLYRALFLKRVLGAADRIIVTSRDYLLSSQAKVFSDDQRVREVPLSVDIERFSPAARRNGMAAVFVGGLDKAHYFKGIEVLLRAFKKVTESVPEARLTIVGGGDLMEEYERQAARLEVSDRVRFSGSVTDDELPGMYRSAGFAILPSLDRSEAFGLVLLEAASTGLPAIASNLPGVRSVIEEGRTGLLVPSGDVDALAEAMRDLLINQEKADQMGVRARERVLAQYSPDKVHSALLGAIDPGRD